MIRARRSVEPTIARILDGSRAVPPGDRIGIVEDGRLLTIREVAARYAASPATIERLVAEGMPCLDLAIHRPGRRPKRNLRFDPAACDRWLARR